MKPRVPGVYTVEPTATFVKQGSLTKYDEQFPLHWAATQGQTQTVRWYIISGYDPNEPDTARESALHCAARHNHANIIQILWNCGANIFAKNAYKETPLDIARASQHPLCIYLLNKLAQTPRGQEQNASTAQFHEQYTFDSADALQRPALKRLLTWTPPDVAYWSLSLGLCQDYSQLLIQHAVDGEVLSDMKTRQDWNELGIFAFGDTRKLIKFQKELNR